MSGLIAVAFIGAGCTSGAGNAEVTPSHETDSPPVTDSKFCAELPSDFLVGDPDQAVVYTEQAMDDSRALYEAMAEAAPTSIGPAVKELQADQEGYFDLLEKYGRDPHRVVAEATPEEMQRLDEIFDGRRRSTEDLVKYIEENCPNVEPPNAVPGD